MKQINVKEKQWEENSRKNIGHKKIKKKLINI